MAASRVLHWPTDADEYLWEDEDLELIAEPWAPGPVQLAPSLITGEVRYLHPPRPRVKRPPFTAASVLAGGPSALKAHSRSKRTARLYRRWHDSVKGNAADRHRRASEAFAAMERRIADQHFA